MISLSRFPRKVAGSIALRLRQWNSLLYRRFVRPRVHELFFRDLILKTDNFASGTWLGNPIWQNVLDLWVVQETIALVRPRLLIECGTNRGGSSLFFAHLFDLIGDGNVVTIDVERLHRLDHPRITYLIGDSTSEGVLDIVRRTAGACEGPVMVILDSDHSREHVRKELESYSPLVTPGSYCLVQDGVIDTLRLFRRGRPGPLAAIDDFLKTSPDFEVDDDRCARFLVSHHPRGWLRRKPASSMVEVAPSSSARGTIGSATLDE